MYCTNNPDLRRNRLTQNLKKHSIFDIFVFAIFAGNGPYGGNNTHHVDVQVDIGI